jgi:hypothetical protein
MERGCEFLKMAILIAKKLDHKGTAGISASDAKCMGSRCVLYPWCNTLEKGKTDKKGGR